MFTKKDEIKNIEIMKSLKGKTILSIGEHIRHGDEITFTDGSVLDIEVCDDGYGLKYLEFDLTEVII